MIACFLCCADGREQYLHPVLQYCRFIPSRFHDWFCSLVQCFSIWTTCEDHGAVVLLRFLTEDSEALLCHSWNQNLGGLNQSSTGNFNEHQGMRYILNVF